MPELPEVETVKNELEPHIIGRRVTDITLNWEGIVRQPSVEDFRSRLIGQTITRLNRRGKYLLFGLSSGEVLVIHLKMTGSLLLSNPPDEKYIRAVIHMDKGTGIYFRDPRKFGVMRLIGDESTVTGKLGPEPLEAGFTAEVLAGLLRSRTAPVKPVLLDQSVIAGIGNMYADESLFDAKIHPLRPSGSLSEDETARLHAAIKRVLWAAVSNKGASVQNYIRPDGTPGTAHFEFRVAHGTGKECPVHHTPIRRIVVRGRGTYFCPECQPAP